MSMVIKARNNKDRNANWDSQVRGTNLRVLKRSELTGRWVDVQQQKERTQKYLQLEDEKRAILEKLNLLPVTDSSRVTLAKRYLLKVSIQRNLHRLS